MKFFKYFLSLFSGLFFIYLQASVASDIKSLDIDGEFSSCSVLKSKYEILKLRLEITEKFGHYVPEIDQKLQALEYKFERLYKSLEFHQVSDEKQLYADVSTKYGNEISTSTPLEEATGSIPEEVVNEGKVQNGAATTDKIYITDIVETEEPKVCKTGANGKPICLNLVLPTSCAEPNDVTCSNNKCRIQNLYISSFVVPCDGDWIVFQRRINGSVDFNRDWSSYKNGFGDLDGEFWLGLDKLHALTKALAPVELLIKMKDFQDTEAYARYESFAIGSEDDNYKMHTLDDYSGDAGDSLTIHRDEKFSTYDSDNDKRDYFNCAQSSTGGWWFYKCDPERGDNSNLNGQYYDEEFGRFQNGIKWETFPSHSNIFKFVEMMIRKI